MDHRLVNTRNVAAADSDRVKLKMTIAIKDISSRLYNKPRNKAVALNATFVC